MFQMDETKNKHSQTNRSFEHGLFEDVNSVFTSPRYSSLNCVLTNDFMNWIFVFISICQYIYQITIEFGP